MTEKEAYSKIIDEVLEELKSAMEKHQEWPLPIFEAFTVISEEVGELAQAILDYKHDGKKYENIKKEALQVAAMGLRFLMNLKDEKEVEKHEK